MQHGNGIARPKLNGFVQSPLGGFLIGQTITFMCWLLLAAVAWGKLTRDFTDRDKWQVEVDKWRVLAQEELNEVRYGHYEDRLRAVEKSSAKIDTIIATQGRIQAELEQKR